MKSVESKKMLSEKNKSEDKKMADSKIMKQEETVKQKESDKSKKASMVGIVQEAASKNENKKKEVLSDVDAEKQQVKDGEIEQMVEMHDQSVAAKIKSSFRQEGSKVCDKSYCYEVVFTELKTIRSPWCFNCFRS